MMSSTTSNGPYSRTPLRRTSSKSRRSSSMTDVSNLSSTSRGRHAFCFLIMFVVAGLVITNVYPQFIRQHTHSKGGIVAKVDDSIITLPLHPKVDKMQGLNHYYLLPSVNNTAIPPRGVLVYLHACHQSGLEVFHLPESRIIVKSALEKGLAVFAPSSFHRESGCYTELDLDYLPRIVEDWTRNHNLYALPRVGMGESSGASFLFFVYKELELQSLAVYNTPQIFPDDEWETAIPTVFLAMALDDPVSIRMTQHALALKQLNITSQIYRVTSRPFTEALCGARFPELPLEFCQQKLFQTLQSDSSLLNADGFALGKTESKQWEKFFRKLELEFIAYRTKNKVPTPYDTNRAGIGHSWLWAVVQQEIQSCQGYHAMTAQYHGEMLHFLLKTSEIDVEGDMMKELRSVFQPIPGAFASRHFSAVYRTCSWAFDSHSSVP